MSTKIIFIEGSPRKNSNTRVVTSIATQAAQEKNAEVASINATKLSFKIPGCAGCGKCHGSSEFGCAIGDELAHTVSTLTQYDVIAIATPIYWMSYPAQLKMLVDRMGSLMKYTDSGKIRTPLAGKVLAILATGGGVLENNLNLLERQWKNIADMLSCQFHSCLFPNTPMENRALENDTSALKKAEAFGQLLASLN